MARGLFLIFCGALLGCLMEHRESPVLSSAIFGYFRFLSIYVLYVSGTVYILLGLCCARSLKQRELTMIRKKKQAVLQASQLKEQKDEIEALLRETESHLMNNV